MNKKKILGIDLGTTNSCVSIVKDGSSQVIYNENGSRITPSVVAFVKDKNSKLQVIVGDAAKRQAHGANAKFTINMFKRLIGKKYSEVSHLNKHLQYEIIKDSNDNAAINIHGESKSPTYISALLLQKLAEQANTSLNDAIKNVVITVPAHFNENQRQATKAAGEIAGLVVERIINEPTAAALAYGLEKSIKGKILVYDLGGGTFDVTILEIEDGVFQVVSTNGDAEIGGEDFDNIILQMVLQDFKEKNKIDISKDSTTIYRVREACKNAKEQLSSDGVTSTIISVAFVASDESGAKHIEYKLERSKFEDKVSHLIEKTINITESTIKDTGKEAINKIILVGGSTRLPIVQNNIKKRFPNIEICRDINPDEAIAMGAAIQGAIISGDKNDIILLEAAQLSLGIESFGGVMAKIIDRNTNLPIKKSKVFTTAADNQTVAEICVYQGERSMVKDCMLLGKFTLKGIKPQPKGSARIEVTFSLDQNNMLVVEAQDQDSKAKQEITLQYDSHDGSTIDKLIKEAEEQKQNDEERKNKIQDQNECDNFSYDIDKNCKDLPQERKDEFTKEKEAIINEHYNKEDYAVAKEKLRELYIKTTKKEQAENTQDDKSQNTDTQTEKEHSKDSPEKEGDKN